MVELRSVVNQRILVCQSNRVVVDVNRVACSSSSSLLPELGLSDCLLNVGMVLIIKASDNTDLVLVLVEELRCHHHLLLELALVRIGLLPLHNYIELVVLPTHSWSVGGTYSMVSMLNLPELAASGVLSLLLIVLRSLPSEIAHGTLGTIMAGALPNVIDKVAIEHGFSHLLLLLSLS